MSSSLKHSYRWIVRNSEVFAWKSLCPTTTKNPGKISAFLYTYFLEIVKYELNQNRQFFNSGHCKVSRRSAYVRALQRTDSHGHTTSQSFFIEANVSYWLFYSKI